MRRLVPTQLVCSVLTYYRAEPPTTANTLIDARRSKPVPQPASRQDIMPAGVHLRVKKDSCSVRCQGTRLEQAIGKVDASIAVAASTGTGEILSRLTAPMPRGSCYQ